MCFDLHQLCLVHCTPSEHLLLLLPGAVGASDGRLQTYRQTALSEAHLQGSRSLLHVRAATLRHMVQRNYHGLQYISSEYRLFFFVHTPRKASEPQKAEGFLLDALKLYVQEGWTSLADDTRLELAQCQQLIGNDER